MTCSALILLVTGMACTFLPYDLLQALGLSGARPEALVIQILGGLYFGFGMLNWMARSSRIGGIYNRPIAIANFSHFFISGIALFKALAGMEHAAAPWWGLGLVYLVFGLLFARILFLDPLSGAKDKPSE